MFVIGKVAQLPVNVLSFVCSLYYALHIARQQKDTIRNRNIPFNAIQWWNLAISLAGVAFSAQQMQ
jgi:hypothetical protein